MDMNNPWWQFAFGAALMLVSAAGTYWGFKKSPAGSPQDALLKILEGILNRKDAQIERMEAMAYPRPSAEAAAPPGPVQTIQAGETIVGVRFRVTVLPQEDVVGPAEISSR